MKISLWTFSLYTFPAMNTEEICTPSVNLSSVTPIPSHYPTTFKNIGQLLALSSQRGPLQTIFKLYL